MRLLVAISLCLMFSEYLFLSFPAGSLSPPIDLFVTAERFARRGYVAVIQDCRGRYKSEGACSNEQALTCLLAFSQGDMLPAMSKKL